MRLQVGRVDRHRPGRLALGGQSGENAVEHAGLAPPHKAIVERFMRAVAGRRITPHQTRTDDVDDAADHLAVVDPRDTAHLVRQQRLKTSELCVLQPEMMVGHGTPYMLGLRAAPHTTSRDFIGPEPKKPDRSLGT